MPRKSDIPKNPLRRIVWDRAGQMCQFPFEPHPVTLDDVRTDVIIPVSQGGKHVLTNLRCLCRRHYLLRRQNVWEKLIEAAIRDGALGEDWREHVWDDPEDQQAG